MVKTKTIPPLVCVVLKDKDKKTINYLPNRKINKMISDLMMYNNSIEFTNVVLPVKEKVVKKRNVDDYNPKVEVMTLTNLDYREPFKLDEDLIDDDYMMRLFNSMVAFNFNDNLWILDNKTNGSLRLQ